MSEQREKIDKLVEIADSGDAEARAVYGLLLREGGNGVVKNERKAGEYLSKSADSEGRSYECDGEGYPLASYYIGLDCLEKTVSVTKRHGHISIKQLGKAALLMLWSCLPKLEKKKKFPTKKARTLDHSCTTKWKIC